MHIGIRHWYKLTFAYLTNKTKENIVAKEEIALYEPFILLLKCITKLYATVEQCYFNKLSLIISQLMPKNHGG